MLRVSRLQGCNDFHSPVFAALLFLNSLGECGGMACSLDYWHTRTFLQRQR
jgi:hypothetical protein